MIDSPPADEPTNVRVLLLVTTRKDADITRRILTEAGLNSTHCETPAMFRAEAAVGAAAVLMTEEAVLSWSIEELVSIIHPADDGMDIPSVVLTRDGAQSAIASTLLARLQNVTILQRPAPITSIVSAVRAAVRARARQQDLFRQMIRIKELQDQLEAALEVSELGTFHCSLPLGAIIWNDRCKAHFWLPADAVVDIDRFYQLLHPDDRARTREAVEACVSHGQGYDIEYRTVSPNGSIRWIRAVGGVVIDGEGRPIRFSGTTQDITVRKNLEEERNLLLESERAARTAGERANRLKDEFLATLSHELRTPLNAITGWVELMKMAIDEKETVLEGLGVVERNVRAQAQLIDDLLDVSRIISGKVRLDTKSLELADVLHAALETVRPAAQAKGVKLELVIGSSTAPVTGDPARLQQVIWNLLTNAIKFTARGGRVQLLLEQEASSVVVSVSDNGEGIEPDFLSHVFERFRQADGSASRSHGGLGLGLSIVKSLTEMHGGAVSAESAGKGRGSCFRIRLPVRSLAAEAREPRVRQKDVSAAMPGYRPNLSGVRVLIVDDEPDARMMMHRLLLSSKALPEEAAGASEALDTIADFHPDVIISDIGMPGMDGYNFIREARRRGTAVPAIALTAFARSEDRIRSIQAGYQAHLSKPVEPTELLTLVASLCGRIDSSALEAGGFAGDAVDHGG